MEKSRAVGNTGRAMMQTSMSPVQAANAIQTTIRILVEDAPEHRTTVAQVVEVLFGSLPKREVRNICRALSAKCQGDGHTDPFKCPGVLTDAVLTVTFLAAHPHARRPQA